jgi:hypothetical protein
VRGGEKNGPVCGVGIEHDANWPPRRRWRGFRSRGGRGFQEVRMISPQTGRFFCSASMAGFYSGVDMPRYRTVLSILVCPSRSCTARRLPVRR